MGDRELLELIAAQVGKLTTDMGKLTTDMGKLTTDVDEIKGRQVRIENTVLRIEQDHGKKLEALFDGYQQNSDRLDRIETSVSSLEEFVLKRVR